MHQGQGFIECGLSAVVRGCPRILRLCILRLLCVARFLSSCVFGWEFKDADLPESGACRPDERDLEFDGLSGELPARQVVRGGAGGSFIRGDPPCWSIFGSVRASVVSSRILGSEGPHPAIALMSAARVVEFIVVISS